MKVAIHETFDFAKSSASNAGNPLSYKLLEDPHDILGQRTEVLEEMFFCFRNNNKMMLTLINNCPHDKSQYESLSHFIVHNFYENIFNSTFVQEDMLVLFYLLLEELIENGNIAGSTKEGTHYLEGTFLFEMFRNLSLKEDIRAYLTVILNKVVSKLESISEGTVLSISVAEIEEYLKEKTILTLNMPPALKNAQTRKHKDIDLSTATSPEEYVQSQNVTLSYLKERLQQIDNDDAEASSSIPEERAFVKSNIALIETNGEECVSVNSLLNAIEHKDSAVKNEVIFNVKKIMYLIDMVIKNLLDNISTIPYTIKCICKIINTLITDKHKSTLNEYDKIKYTITFFFECILLPILLNPDYNGVITTSIISSNVRRSLATITTILRQIRKGVLFTSSPDNNNEYTVFNMFIMSIMPNVIKLFTGIQSTKLPTALEKLITKRGSADRDINYSYFKHNHTENMTHQSICFNWDNALTFIKIIKKHKSKFIELLPEMKSVFNSVILYESDFANWIAKDMQGTTHETRGVSVKIKEIKYVYFGKIIFKEEFKAILEGKKTLQSTISLNNAFSFTSDLANSQIASKKSLKKEYSAKDKTDEEELFKKKRAESLLTNIKKSLCEILQYINTISKENFNIKELTAETDSFTKYLLPRIITIMKYEMSNNNDCFYKNKDKTIPIIYFITFLERNIVHLPDHYKKDNFALLFGELLRESESSLQNMKNDVINQIYLKIKNSDKLNMIINNNLSQVKQMEKTLTVEYLVDVLKIVVTLEYQKTGDKIVSVSLDTEDNSSNMYLEDTISSIKSFIELFPSFADSNETDPIEYEEQLEVDKLINRYFALIKQHLKSNERMLRYTNDEFNAVNEALQNYIMNNIYHKLVPYSRTKKDIFIHNKCKRLHWVKPVHLIKDQKVVNEKLWQLAMEYINNMDNETTPTAKIKCFNKAFGILQNSITFCTGKDELGVDDSLQVLIYVIIKAQPKKIWTNFNYARLFIDPELSKKQFGLLLTQLEMVITVINDLKHSDLMGVTEEEFGKDEKMEDIEIDKYDD